MHARRIPDQRDAMLQRDQRGRQPVAGGVVNGGIRGVITAGHQLVETHNEPTADQYSIQLTGDVRQTSQRGDLVRPLGRCFPVIGKPVQRYRAQAPGQFRLGENGKQQVAIIGDIECAEDPDLPLSAHCSTPGSFV